MIELYASVRDAFTYSGDFWRLVYSSRKSGITLTIIFLNLIFLLRGLFLSDRLSQKIYGLEYKSKPASRPKFDKVLHIFTSFSSKVDPSLGNPSAR